MIFALGIPWLERESRYTQAHSMFSCKFVWFNKVKKKTNRETFIFWISNTNSHVHCYQILFLVYMVQISMEQIFQLKYVTISIHFWIKLFIYVPVFLAHNSKWLRIVSIFNGNHMHLLQLVHVQSQSTVFIECFYI